MPLTRLSVPLVRAMLDRLGVTLADDSEYAEVALRLEILLDGTLPLMARYAPASEAVVPADLPRPEGGAR